jgi:murein DD-endopeptidase MepM/ murein hydrolase activator NlpD
MHSSRWWAPLRKDSAIRRSGQSIGAPWRRRGLNALVAATAALLLLVTGTLAGSEKPAYAVEYPSWNDVLEARGDVTTAQAKIREIRATISAIAAEVATTQAVAEEKGSIYYEAQLAFDEAAYTADQLQAQADDAQVRADESRSRAGQFVAELARSGGGDLSASLFTNPGAADDLLSRLGFASKITEQAEGIYAAALQDQNAAQALTDQANVAKQIRDELRIETQTAFEEAQLAAQAAQVALQAQQDNQARLEAQLSVLVENRDATEADFAAGVAARAAAEAAARAAEAAARAAAAAAQAAAGGSGGSAGAGQTANGWAVPVSGGISSHFGNRVHPFTGGVAFHSGTDIAAPCGRPMFAAAGGTVEYAGWNGGYGNYVRINHGGGVATAYGHIQQGGILVQMGQSVSAGQQIALVGTTGQSTGCHLHFEVRQGGVATDPVTYLRNRGLSFG